ncbi:hypothetical protein OS189_00355 [Sulfitobacter sp. F26169L]|uniref:hypothetical protein n=1 Tax=Sulfitobacter sp. F26169L TaxID=2996015 RepID=UPI002260825E|nr:hypothetical protein [Sulfitobacter sp. F26169L]MCX7564790.1 hypothetical protein [Sulfitobacter sp. F26169L]
MRLISIVYERFCTVRPIFVDALNAARIQWQRLLEIGNSSPIHATVNGDLAVHAAIKGTEPPQLVRIKLGGALPDLPVQMVNLYQADEKLAASVSKLVSLLQTQIVAK